jgi:hypothetical protein
MIGAKSHSLLDVHAMGALRSCQRIIKAIKIPSFSLAKSIGRRIQEALFEKWWTQASILFVVAKRPGTP